VNTPPASAELQEWCTQAAVRVATKLGKNKDNAFGDNLTFEDFDSVVMDTIVLEVTLHLPRVVVPEGCDFTHDHSYNQYDRRHLRGLPVDWEGVFAAGRQANWAVLPAPSDRVLS